MSWLIVAARGRDEYNVGCFGSDIHLRFLSLSRTSPPQGLVFAASARCAARSVSERFF